MPTQPESPGNSVKVLFAIALVFAIIFGARWLASPVPIPTSVPPPAATNKPNAGAQLLAAASNNAASSLSITKGASLYASHCASCHGVDLEGQPDWQTPNADGSLKAPPHDDSGHTWHHDDTTLVRYTKLGGNALMAAAGVSDFKSGMPGFADTLSDEEINHVLDFIKSRWSKRSQKVQRERTRTAGGS